VKQSLTSLPLISSAAGNQSPNAAKQGGNQKGLPYAPRYDPAQFNAKAQNVGVQMGPVSKNLVDTDLDAKEAIGLAPEFLPDTNAIFGHASKPWSHQLSCSQPFRAMSWWGGFSPSSRPPSSHATGRDPLSVYTTCTVLHT
jgi:hypothetical protein